MRATRFSRRALGVAGVLSLGISGLVVATTATAADGNIDVARTGSLTVHKYQSGTLNPNGTPDGKTSVQGTPVADVVFTVHPISNLDLSKQESWNGLGDLKVPVTACGTDGNTPSLMLPDNKAATFDAGIALPKTDAQGTAKKDSLAVKAYLVCESSAPASVKQKAAPFLVTIPFPNNEVNSPTSHDGNWLYDINVYPKNVVVDAPSKEVTIEGTKHGIKTGEQVTFPVSAKVPSIGANDAFKYFIISDPFNENLQNGKVKSVKIDGADVDADKYTKTDGQTSTVAFTKAGLEHLKTKLGSTVTVEFTADVKSVPADGVIPNVANLYVDTIPGTPDRPSTPPDQPPSTPPAPNDDPGTPSNKVVSTWGNLKIAKQDKDNSKALEGATFQVYNASAATAYADDCSTAVKEGDPIAVGAVSEFTTGADGTLNVEGLFVDKKVGVAGAADVTPDHNKRCYVIVETKAPAGYTLPATADATKGVTVRAGVSTTADITVDNTKTTVPPLPVTGAAGKILMTVGGLSIMAIAVGFVLVARKRRVNEA
ncbi:SpaH/EbpB family LPXTG-anchored major pilin [Actinomyces gaoshouyii]|uniref:Type-2 fimbrial major subunit n=1 Tax=Actinomyces gaoshouyii TaxID=1960083 RepID=A0A8H9LEG0_9ACTO|nr:SpaH/EbpB family LPXTG-anchored major pilin [Actinomyces gaoshouyii]GGO96375.1 type-2 fimbrial major subunit [Actinomyces gaoshouyii]